MKIWQKKDSKTNSEIEKFTVGNDYILDMDLVPYDILGSLAHAKTLEKAGVLDEKEISDIEKALQDLQEEYVSGKFEIKPEDEDCHTAIEKYLTDKIGEAGKKIHTGRSRNDQVLTALNLYTKSTLEKIAGTAKQLQDVLLQKAEQYQSAPMVGHTHTRPGMPSTFGMWFASFAEQLADDLVILEAAKKLVDQNPLGTAAGYGPSITLDRELSTKELNFSEININPIATQNSRGKISGLTLHAMSQVMTTIGRLANDAIWFSHPSLNYLQIPDELTTGSSIMPNKKNPDVLELVRGYVNVVSHYEGMVMYITKNLFSGYNRDLQLCKEPLMKGLSITQDSLEIMNLFVEKIVINKDIELPAEIYAADQATKLAIEKNIPFRDAYREVGSNGEYKKVLTKKETIGAADNLSLDKIKNKWKHKS